MKIRFSQLVIVMLLQTQVSSVKAGTKSAKSQKSLKLRSGKSSKKSSVTSTAKASIRGSTSGSNPGKRTNTGDDSNSNSDTDTNTSTKGLCSTFECGDGYSLRSNPDTTSGKADRATCCIRDGVCAGAISGTPCSLGDISSSLIPNPSFEDFTSCPTAETQMFLADTWVQASAGTSDFWVGSPTCDDSFWRSGIVGIGSIPQSASDGVAFVGSIKYASGTYYEYIGACLTSPLQAGTTYTFTLDIAAAKDDALWGGDTSGTTELLCVLSCNDFQMAGWDYKGDTYEILATASPNGGLIGGGDWKSITFVTTPTEGCPAIMFGPGLDQTSQSGKSGSYVIYDALNLQEGVAGVCNEDGECVVQS